VRRSARRTPPRSYPASRQRPGGSGVSDSSYKKYPHPKPPRGGQAAAVAGYAGPGFHHWPPGHIPQNTDSKPRIRIRRVQTGLKKSSERRSARRAPPRSYPASRQRPGGSGVSDPSYKKSRDETTTRRPRRRCSRVRRPRFPPLAPRPHPSKHGFETTDPNPTRSNRTQKTFGETFGEARAATVVSSFAAKTGRLRGQRPQLQKIPASETTTRRPSRRCSRGRWPRFPPLAPQATSLKHRIRNHGSESGAFEQDSKNVRRDVR
jgi:hypothetical protein